MRGYPDTLVNKVLSEVKFEERNSALQQNEKTQKNIHNSQAMSINQYLSPFEISQGMFIK